MVTGRFGIVLFRGSGLIARIIRWQTRSPYSHAALLLPDGNLIESMQGAGVRRCELSDLRGADIYLAPSVTSDQWLDAYQFATDQLGKRYNYLGVLRFLSRRRMGRHDTWFCSELVFAALKQAGVDLMKQTEPWEVSPRDLSRSALLDFSPLPGQRFSLVHLHRPRCRGIFAAIAAAAAALLLASCQLQDPPDPMGTGIEATRYILWVFGLPEGPPMTAGDLRAQTDQARRTRHQKTKNQEPPPRPR